jgi:M6 family metalloprotease-like protein
METVKLTVKGKRLFVGSFTPVRVEIDPASGLTMDDLLFEVSSREGGIVSTARRRDAQHPEVMLLAGHGLGTHEIVAVDRRTGAEAGRAAFTLTDRWAANRTAGPSFWLSGRQDIAHPTSGAWGGGPVGPQNTRPTPLAGTWRVAIVFADTSSQRYPTAQADRDALRDLWLDHWTDGTMDNGMLRSVRTYVEEVSYGNLTLSVDAFGPYSLTGAWTDYFDAATSGFRGTLVDAAIAAADADVDFRNYETLVIVTPRVPEQPGATPPVPERAAWPYATLGRAGGYTTADGTVSLGIISMVSDWGQQAGNTREIFETGSHELAHNLGLSDQYSPQVGNRNVGGWDLMHADSPHPHVSVSHRMMLGWVRPGWVRSLDFSASQGPFDQPVQLHPIELGQPPAGRWSAVEVRIADGLNQYYEYRRGQVVQIGDRALPTDDRVVGTDLMADVGTAPVPRPQLLLLPKHANDDGAVLGNGNKYIDTDVTTPGFPQEFRVDVSGADGTKADLRVRYGANGRPDPSIRPWPAGPDRPWQSPDIEVRNARSNVRPEWLNVPWGGHANTVAASVRNGGTVAAPDVTVNFFVKNYNIGSAPEFFLGSDTRTIGPGQTVEFTTTWDAPASGHFCVIARIPLYQVPSAPSIVELTELNNMAQSNYDRFIPTTASPSTRESTTVEVSNPYDKSTYVYLNAAQTNPTYRALVGHRWLKLAAGEVRQVPVMFEWAPVPGEDRLPPDLQDLGWQEVMKLSQVPNKVGLWAFIADPDEDPPHSVRLLGGAVAEVQVGRRVHFEDVRAGRGSVRGRVVTDDDGRGVERGAVIVTLDHGTRPRPGDYRYVDTEVSGDGEFAVEVPSGWRRLWCDYLPDPGFGAATSDVVRQGRPRPEAGRARRPR